MITARVNEKVLHREGQAASLVETPPASPTTPQKVWFKKNLSICHQLYLN